MYPILLLEKMKLAGFVVDNQKYLNLGNKTLKLIITQYCCYEKRLDRLNLVRCYKKYKN